MKERCENKAQVSVEYLLIIALAFAVLLPTGYFFYKYSQTSGENAIRSQINQLGNKILSNSESIYGLADGSLVNQDVNYVSNIREVKVLGTNELVISYELSTGLTESVFFSRIALSGPYNTTSGPPYPLCIGACENSSLTESLPTPGKHNIRFESKTNYVLVNMTE